MTIKTILVYLPSEKLAAPVLDAVVALAGQRGAHVIGLHLEASYYPAYGEVAIAMPPDVIEQMRKPLREQAERLKQSFNARMESEKISAEWRTASVEYSTVPTRIVEESLTADLVICPKVDPTAVDVTTLDLPERLILEGGRPVLVVPPDSSAAIPPKRVLIAWNNSPQSARAVFESLDLFGDAETVTVLTVAGDAEAKREAEESANNLAASLKRHGIEAKAEAFEARNVSAGDFLRTRLEDDHPDLLVMGCYGHSRFRELVFGGVTRDILGATQVPTLMSH